MVVIEHWLQRITGFKDKNTFVLHRTRVHLWIKNSGTDLL